MSVPSQLASPPLRAVATIESINPATQEVNARFEVTQPGNLPAIFERAREAQKEWSSRTLRERCAKLRDLRNAIFTRRDEIADIVTREAGKPRVEAIFAEVLLALDTADFLARQAPRWLRPERVPHHNLAMKAKSGWMEFSPLGVVAIISPWNYPFSIPMAQVIPALVTGNAVLLKPSDLTPWCGQLVGELVEQAKCPTGLVQVLQGGGEIGAALIEAGPDKIFFTGSVTTGQRIAEACAKKLIPSVLELGGKDATIVLADADLDVASSAAVWGGFMNCGETCISVERIYVEQRIAERFTELCVAKTKKLRAGPATDPRYGNRPDDPPPPARKSRSATARCRRARRANPNGRKSPARSRPEFSRACRRHARGPLDATHARRNLRACHCYPSRRKRRRGRRAGKRFTIRIERQRLDQRHAPRQGNRLAHSRRLRDDQRCRKLLRHHAKLRTAVPAPAVGATRIRALDCSKWFK